MDGGEKSVQDTLAGQKWDLTCKLLSDGSGVTDGPEVGHVDVLLLAVGVFNNTHSLADVILALGHDLDNSTLNSGGDHDSVLREKVVFEGLSNHVTASDDVSLLEELGWLEKVETVLVE